MSRVPRDSDEYERSAAGLDFDNPIREHATSFGAKLAEGGPGALLDQVEEILPESWREQIRAFPLAALAVGVGVGVFLGLKKGDEMLAAGSSLVSAAAMANVTRAINRQTDQEEEA